MTQALPTPFFDKLPKAEFGGLKFPYTSIQVSGGWRHHIHEWPHVNGGAIEKIGRELYRFSVTPVFDENVDYDDENNGLPLYPEVLRELQRLFHTAAVSQLIMPTVGSMPAFISKFSRRINVALRSGEEVSLEFIEDRSVNYKIPGALPSGTGGVRRRKLLWENAIDDYIKKSNATKTAADIDLLDQITGFADSVLAIVDSVELITNQVAGKLGQLSQLVQRADRALSFISNPQAWPVVESGKNLWQSVNDLKDTATRANDVREYVTPAQMTLPSLSAAVYGGDASRGRDILDMNSIEDALAIPAGTVIRYLP
jgi:prophage DNA circulation protein